MTREFAGCEHNLVYGRISGQCRLQECTMRTHKRSGNDQGDGDRLVDCEVLQVNDTRRERRRIKGLVAIDLVVRVQKLDGADGRQDGFVVHTHRDLLRESREFDVLLLLERLDIG